MPGLNDPYEMHNRYADPKYAPTIAEMKSQLKQVRKELGKTDANYPAIRKIIDAHP